MTDASTNKALSGNDVLSLLDSDDVWLVNTGRVDVFVLDREGSELPRPWHHLLRVEVGGAVLCLGGARSDSGIRLVAVGGPGTTLRRLTDGRADDSTPGTAVDGGELLERWAYAIDDWVEKLCTRMGGDKPPARSVTLAAGQSHELGADPAIFHSASGVAWVRVGRAVRLLGRGDLSDTSSGESVPIAEHCWICCPAAGSRPESASLSVVRTLDELQRAGGLAFLGAFHRAVLEFAAADKWRAESQADERVLTRAEFDRRYTADALTRLAEAMDGSMAEHLGGEATPHTSEPLLAVMRVVGQELGCDVRAPPPVIDGVPDVYAIEDIARASRIGWRRVRLRGKWWRRDAGPLVTYLRREGREDVPVALTCSGARYLLHTPDGQIVRLSPGAVADLRVDAWSLYRLLPDRMLGWVDLLRFSFHGNGPDLARAAVVGVQGALLGLVVPAATQALFDTIIPGALRSELTMLVAMLAIAGVAILAFQFVRDVAVMRLRARVGAALETAVWARLLALPTSFFRNYDAGDLADRIMGLSAVQERLAGSTLSTLLSSGFSAAGLLLMFYYSPHLTLAAVVVTGVACGTIALGGFWRVQLERQIADLRGEAQGFVLQAVTAISKLRVARGEHRAFARWARLFSRQRALQVRAHTISNFVVAGRQSLPLLTTVLLFAMVAHPEAGPMSAGVFVGFLVAFGQFITGALQAAVVLVDLTAVAPLLERARPLLEAVPETDERKPRLGDIHGRIELNHVCFRYRDESPLILDDISIAIEPGDFVAVVGKSGSGKSTLFRLLLGFERPTAGAVYFDGHDLAGIDVRAMRRQMGSVLQTSRVMAGSIFDNIVASSNRTLEDAWAAARMAGLADDIDQMPMGMHTIIAAGGGTLSGGQRQRLLIARALVKQPRVILFDEATSALDNQTQAIVSRSLERLHLTRIVVAHRLSTIRNADSIVVLDKGRIVQAGTYEELLDQPGLFAELAKRQLA